MSAVASDSTAELADLVARSARVVVLSGAGISTESGIPDFRSPGGVWTRYDPTQLTFERYVADPDVRRQSWQMRREFFDAAPRPNAAHRAVARLERSDQGLGVITQNIDGLHQEAGAGNVVEIHGTAREVMCIGDRPVGGVPDGCGFRADHDWVIGLLDAGEDDPRCPECDGLVKSATVSFGQALFPDSVAAAERLAGEADLMIAVGSSLQVFPAAGLPMETITSGGRLAIVNDEATPLDELAAVVVRGRTGEVLPEALAAYGR